MKAIFEEHIGIFPNIAPPQWCDDVIKYFEANYLKSKPRTPQEISRGISDTSYFLYDENLKKGFNKFFPPAYLAYRDKYPFMPTSLDINEFKLQKTLPTEGFFPFHIEHSSTPPGIYRVGVYTLYLNDVEEGGETEFLYQLKRIKATKGTLVIFPAGYTHVHRGNTPFSGEKYIMTGWLEAPKNKNIGS